MTRYRASAGLRADLASVSAETACESCMLFYFSGSDWVANRRVYIASPDLLPGPCGLPLPMSLVFGCGTAARGSHLSVTIAPSLR